jgi:lipopolysaccharide transport system ATP-binding protein
MSRDVVIRAEGLGKRFVIGHQQSERYTALRDVIARGARNLARSSRDVVLGRQIVAGDELEEFWALREVDFEVRRGEVLGVIGRNGAGKSTLLKILSRITEPSEGRVTLHGRVASLLEVGTGFHPELSGRENVFLNGAILGMSRAEIRRKFDEIVAFAGVERFLDTPVKRYSSGMYVRLAFAVAAHLESEIMVVDEVLAVGDAEFQAKCLGKMHDVAGQGRTVLFVSHQLGSISQLCPRSMLMEAGRLKRAGPTSEIIALYNRRDRQAEEVYHFDAAREHPPIRPIIAYAHDGGGQAQSVFASNAPIHLAIQYDSARAPASARIGLRLSTPDGQVLFTSGASDLAVSDALGQGESVLSCAIPPNLLAPGQYMVSFAADIPLQEVIFNVENVLTIAVTEEGAVGAATPDGRLGLLRPGLVWKRIGPAAARRMTS